MNLNEINRLYSEYLDDAPQASEEVKKTYKTMNEAFDSYLCAVQDDRFRSVFLFGYMRGVDAAKAEMLKGGAVNG